MKSFLRNVKGVIVFSVVTLNTIVCFVPIMVLALLKFLAPAESLRAFLTRTIMTIGELWIAVNSRIFGSVSSTRWHVDGLQDLSPDKWYLLVANHQTWVDIVALQTQLNRRIPFLKFFIKQQLIWFPLLGQAWWAMDMPFMKRHSKSYLARYPEKKGSDLESTRKACLKFKSTPTSVINFIEGTRFTAEKRVRRMSPFEHLLPPRAGGMALALSSMGEMFDAILDVTIVYPNGEPPLFWSMICGEFSEVVIKVRQRPVERWMLDGDYAEDREFRRQFHQWLTALWEEKDLLIGEINAEHDVAGNRAGNDVN